MYVWGWDDLERMCWSEYLRFVLLKVNEPCACKSTSMLRSISAYDGLR